MGDLSEERVKEQSASQSPAKDPVQVIEEAPATPEGKLASSKLNQEEAGEGA